MSIYYEVIPDDTEVIGYAYSNVSLKNTYSGGFATLEPVILVLAQF
jgi:hypothetical protein